MNLAHSWEDFFEWGSACRKDETFHAAQHKHRKTQTYTPASSGIRNQDHSFWEEELFLVSDRLAPVTNMLITLYNFFFSNYRQECEARRKNYSYTE